MNDISIYLPGEDMNDIIIFLPGEDINDIIIFLPWIFLKEKMSFDFTPKVPEGIGFFFGVLVFFLTERFTPKIKNILRKLFLF